MVGVMKIIFLMVTPIIFNTFVYNASSYLDSKIFSDILNMKGIAAKVVSGQWGEYSNYYITLINIPLALSSATSSGLRKKTCVHGCPVKAVRVPDVRVPVKVLWWNQGQPVEYQKPGHIRTDQPAGLKIMYHGRFPW